MKNGKNIKAARLYRGFTQEKLANKCNLATGTIQQYELNKRNPKIEQIVKISEALHLGYTVFNTGEVAFSDLIDESSPDPKAQEFNRQQLESVHVDEDMKSDFYEEVQKIMKEEKRRDDQTRFYKKLSKLQLFAEDPPKDKTLSQLFDIARENAPTDAELKKMYQSAVIGLMDDMNKNGQLEIVKHAKYIHSQDEYLEKSDDGTDKKENE